MKLLLDTHVVLWAAAGDARLSRTARKLLGGAAQELYFSAASAWEIFLKTRAGRLKLADGPEKFLEAAVRNGGLTTLPVLWRHVMRLNELPDHHRDPFDRLLVAQCQSEKLAIVTADENISRYAVDVIW